MSWFFIALIAPAFWAASNFIDKYLLNKYFQDLKPEVLVIISSLVGILVVPLIAIFVPGVWQINIKDLLILLISGILLMVTLFPYLYALMDEDVSSITTIFQTIPIFSYILGFIFLNETLNDKQIFASSLIIFGAIGISLDLSTKKLKFKSKPFFLMLLASFSFSFAFFLFKFVTIADNYWVSNFWLYIGTLIPAIFMLIFIKKYRHDFFQAISKHKTTVIGLNIVNEVLDTAAKMAMNFATLLVPLALAWVVNGFQPLLALFYGIILTIFFPNIIKEDISKKIVLQKLVFIIFMFIGGYLLN